MNKKSVIKLIIILTIFLIIIDQISKYIIQYNYKEPIETGIVSLILVKNDGIAFSMNSGNTKNIVITLIILLIVINFVRSQKDKIDKKTAISVSMILAGGIGNLIDRIIHGGVIDFIKLEHFAIFNIADCYVVIGWILLIISFIRFNMKKVEVENCEK